jgi:hypothetical protein
LKHKLSQYSNKEDETKRRLEGMSVWSVNCSILKKFVSHLCMHCIFV